MENNGIVTVIHGLIQVFDDRPKIQFCIFSLKVMVKERDHGKKDHAKQEGPSSSCRYSISGC
jgi:hypothetical protein